MDPLKICISTNRNFWGNSHFLKMQPHFSHFGIIVVIHCGVYKERKNWVVNWQKGNPQNERGKGERREKHFNKLQPCYNLCQWLNEDTENKFLFISLQAGPLNRIARNQLYPQRIKNAGIRITFVANLITILWMCCLATRPSCKGLCKSLPCNIDVE